MRRIPTVMLARTNGFIGSNCDCLIWFDQVLTGISKLLLFGWDFGAGLAGFFKSDSDCLLASLDPL